MQTLDASQLKAWQNARKTFQLYNVLDPDAFARQHIPGSKNRPVSKDDFVRSVEQDVRKDDPVVVYCASTECNASAKAAERLRAAGFTKVYDFEAGMDGWKQAGFPVERGAAADG